MPDPITDAEGDERGAPNFDPRDIVTPHAFAVDEALLGTPLAAPWRRLVALLVDLALAGIIAHVAGSLVGLVVAYIFYRVATRPELTSRWKRWARGCLVPLGALVLFGVAISLVQDVQKWGAVGPSLTAVLPGVSPDTTSRRASPTEPDGASPRPPDGPRRHAARPSLDTRSSQQSAALLRRYAAALTARDTASLDTLAGPVQSIVAGRRLDRLGARVDVLEAENDDLLERVNQLKTPSIWRMVRGTVNDLGITVGWVGLYFTLFLAWWGGRTPGKYLLGIRVVRLSGEPLSLWFAFERFGGYAAGIATGLLGFAQLYWDPNRQAIHDRVARTVVIRTRSSQ